MNKPKKNSYFDALAYIALFATVSIAATAIVPPFANIASFAFPFTSLITAALLLWRNPKLYIGFMWWTWFLTPEVRRIVDYRTGYHEQSLIMLTPFLVVGVALVPVLFNLAKLKKPYRLPLAFTTLGLLYGYGVGLFNNSLASASFDLLSWGVPVIGGAYVLTHQHHASAFQQATQRAFIWGLLIMGLYGAVQYFYLPVWDAYWMKNSDLTSIGSPEPQQVRVFSTLNAPGPFANVVMAGLLLAFGKGGTIKLLGAAAGFVGFALSAVRSAWGGWFIGLLVMVASLPLRKRLQPIGLVIVLSVVGVPLFTVGPVAELLSQRLSTVTDLQNDVSFNARSSLYTDFVSFTANNPLGQGLGSTGGASVIGNQEADFQDLDSGIIAVVYTFGVLGTLYFVGGALAIFGSAILAGRKKRDVTSASYIGITVAALGQLFFGNAWNGVGGMVLWFFPCLYLATLSSLHSSYQTQPSSPSPKLKGAVKVYRA